MIVSRVNKPAYLPTPDEIERECEKIQRRWSDSERERRLLFVVTESESAPADPEEIWELLQSRRAFANAPTCFIA